jgi:hypothetical protein
LTIAANLADWLTITVALLGATVTAIGGVLTVIETLAEAFGLATEVAVRVTTAGLGAVAGAV